MGERVSRAEWGARLATGSMNVIGGNPEGCTVHWEGPKMGSFPHSLCAGKVRGIQRFHQVTRGWSDIAYNEVVCPHGVRFEGRGYGVGSAANGTTAANKASYAICVLVGQGDTIAPVVLDAVADAVADYRKYGKAGNVVKGHRDWFNTACPGDFLYAEVKKGTFGKGSAGKATNPRPPASAVPSLPATKRPAPGPHYGFPLPGGYYFGKDDGTNASVSGKYHRVFKGHPDSWWLQQFATQLARRGWSVGKGKTWLSRYGNDGEFGDEYASLVGAFQADQGLRRDDKLGPITWRAAFENPVT